MRTIALVSGGMDSVTALYNDVADAEIDVAAALFIRYGQRGETLEYYAAQMSVNQLATPIALYTANFYSPARSALTNVHALLDVDIRVPGRPPAIFVPGRNLIMIGLAASLAFDLGADTITGGWVEQDTPYPDCRYSFIGAVAEAVQQALDNPQFLIHAPMIANDKQRVVKIGTRLGVPWRFTRSCYSEGVWPCCKCDSCLKRMEAFYLNDMQDPIVGDDEWEKFVTRWRREHEQTEDSV